MLALDQGRPRMLTLKDILSAFVAFREEVITRRTVHELGQARDRAHILVGLGVAVANIDEIIAIIRKAPDPATARAELIGRRWPAGEVAAMIRLIDEPGAPLGTDDSYQLSEAQARAILDLRLHRLTALERDKIAGELQEITDRIQEYLLILSSRAKRLEVLKGELAEMRERFAVPRRTAITEGEFEEDMEALIQREEMVVTVTHSGYIKRVPLSTYRAQRRGGKGRAGMSMKDQDFVTRLFVTSTHTPVLFFSSRGLAYMMKVYRLPQGSPQSRGKALVNLLPLSEDETITAILPLPEDEGVWEQHNILFVTSTGKVRRNKLSDFRNIRANGLIAMKLDESEHLVSVRLAQPDDTLLLTSAQGKGIRFPVDDIRVFSGRTSTGVRGIRLAPGDEVVAMSVLAHVATVSEERQAYLRRAAAERRGETSPGEADGLDEARYRDLAAAEEFILTVADTGMGKVTSAYEYRISGRGGQGIQAMDMSARRVGRLVTSFPVTREDEIMLVTDHGQLIRIPVDDLRVMGRQTQGVRLFRIDDDERVVSVAWIPEEETPAGEVAPADAAPGPEAEPPPAVGGGESETGGGEASPES